MAQIQTNSIIDTDSIYDGGLTKTNANFGIVQDAINALGNIVDTTNNLIANVQSVNIQTNPGNNSIGANPSVQTFNTNGSGNFDGNLSVGTAIQGKELDLAAGQGITVTNGSIILNDSTGAIQSAGSLTVNKQVVYPSYIPLASTDYSNQLLYPSGSYLVDNVNGNIGFITLNSSKGITLDFSSYNGGATYSIRRVRFLTANVPTGQEVSVIFLLNETASPAYTILVDPTNIAATVTNKINSITIYKSYSVINMVYLGATNGWVITSTFGGVTIA